MRGACRVGRSTDRTSWVIGWAALALTLVLHLATQSAVAEVNYVVIDLNPAGFFDSQATGASGGVAVGWGQHSPGDQGYAMLWGFAAGSVVDLHPAGFIGSSANGVSGDAQVGQGWLAGGEGHALLWRGTAASVVDLHPAGFIMSYANGVSGDVQVGYGSPASGEAHALLWWGTAASVVDLHPAGFISSWASGVSADVQVGAGYTAGWERHAFLWRGTAASVVDLHPAGLDSSWASGVSADVQVGAGCVAGGPEHALLWRGTAASVVDLHPAGFIYSYANGVSGDFVVGQGDGHALLWRGTAESVIDLHKLIPAATFNSSSASAVDEGGNVVGSGICASPPVEHALLWWATGPLSVPALTIGPQSLPGPFVTLDAAKTLNVEGTLAIAPDSSLRLEGAGVDAGVFLLEAGGTLSGHGTVSGPVYGEGLSRISAEGGDLVLGDAGRYDGFSHQGTLSVGANTVTLSAKGFAVLGRLTELAGGLLRAPNGVYLSGGGNLVGTGGVDARIAASQGSTIQATGALAIGSQAAYDGFFSDGTLIVGSNTVTLNDRNEAVLGSMTTVGDAGGQGNLTAANGMLLEQGKNLVGYGKVDGDFINQGYVKGEGPAPTDLLEFTGPVWGTGVFEGAVHIDGGLAVPKGGTMTKSGDGLLVIGGPQEHGPNSKLAVTGGAVDLNTDAGMNGILSLTVCVTGASAANLGATQHLAALNLAGGARANLAAGHDKVLVAKALGIEEVAGSPTSRLDLADNAMVIDYDDPAASPLQDITRWIASGCDGRLWDGNGIVSTTAAGNPFTVGLGYAQNDLLFAKDQYSTFAGEPVDLTSVLVKYTYLGDVNLDGKVDDNDVTIMVLGYDRGLVSTHTWQQGDISGYDGKIDDNDITVLVLNYGAGWKPGRGGPLGEMSGAVPEPATLALLALGGLALLGRRRAAAPPARARATPFFC